MSLTPRSGSRALSLWGSVSAACLAVLTTVTPSVAQTHQHNPYELLDQMGRVLVLVENEYVKPVDRSKLLEGSIKGMVAELDPHSAYLPAGDYAIFQGDTEGRFGGIGVEVDFANDQVVVIAPIEGSPAERGGVRSGDRIIAIDEAPVSEKSPDQLVREMRGPPGTKVMITVKRPGQARLMHFKLVREVIKVSSIASKLLSGGILYLRVKSFQNGTHRELLEHVAKLRETTRQFSGILLDLRNNPGGLVSEASALADEFLTGGVIYTTRHRETVVREVRARKAGALRRGPMVVLINEFSASAAELVAGALRDNHRAALVGTPTFGKGSVQTIIDLPNGAGLKLTTALYYTPSGQAIQAAGVKPDVEVEAAYATERDYQVIREADLEGHIRAGPGETAAEPGEEEQPNVEKRDSNEEQDSDEEQDTHLGVARTIPDDPTGGPDFALSIGYQIVTGVMSQRR